MVSMAGNVTLRFACMENSTALLLRQREALAAEKPLFVEVDDPALAGLWPHARLHTDNRAIARQCPRADFAAWPVFNAETRVILAQPKAHERLAFLLDRLAAQLATPVECWLIGPAKGGIKGALKHLEARATNVTLRDSARHCKLYSGMLQPAQPGDGWLSFQAGDFTLHSLPGIFNHGHLDEGTALLLEDIKAGPLAGNKMLDAGCGAGVLALHLAALGHQVTALDISATALAACRRNLADHQFVATVQAGDLLDEVQGRFHAIVSNPPFHAGMARDITLARRLIEQSRAHLTSNGELRLVANRNLPYHDWLEAAFRQVEISRENSRFRVWRARQPR